MANEVISANQTTTYVVDLGDVVYVPSDVSVTTSGSPAVAAAPGAYGMALFVDGTLTSLGWFGSTIAFGTSEPNSYKDVTIGTTGQVNGVFSGGVQITGNGSTFVNHGSVVVTDTAVQMSSPNTAGGYLSFQNSGTISGSTAVVISGNSAEGTNTGRIDAEYVGLNLALYSGSFLNAGLVSSAEDGAHLSGESPDFMNTGRIEVLGAGIRCFVDDGLITNAGVISAGGVGIHAAVTTGTRVVNTGTVTAEEGGIEVVSTLASVRSTGAVSAGGTGVLVQGNGAAVAIGGSVDAGASGVDVQGDDAVVTVDATVEALGDWGVHVGGDAARIDLGGRIIGTVGLYVLGNGADIANAAAVTGRAIGMVLSSYDPVTPVVGRFHLDNAGTIRGTTGGISSDIGRLDLLNSGEIRSDTFAAVSTQERARVVNTGLIAVGPDAGVAFRSFGSEADAFRNFGTVIGSVLVGNGADLVRNRGLVDGNVDLGIGDDVYDARGGGATLGAVLGGGGGDTLTGGQADDDLRGDSGDDLVRGGAGDDTLAGGTGRDTLAGGSGADVFLYLTAAEIGTGNKRDRIEDFAAGQDMIDLSAFMAGGTYIGTNAFPGSSGPLVRYNAAAFRIEGDVNGDGTADFEIDVAGISGTLSARDFDFVA